MLKLADKPSPQYRSSRVRIVAPTTSAGRIRELLPGVTLTVIIAAVAHGITGSGTLGSVSPVTVAVFTGLLVGNVSAVPLAATAGVKFSATTLLRLGVVLLGARLGVQAVISTGAEAILVIVVSMATALLLARLLGARLRMTGTLALLVGVGTAICGNAAIAAMAPIVGSKQRDISFAVATITLFGMLALVLYPAIGHALNLSNETFGLWSGIGVNDTSQVVATGYSYSSNAGDVATVVKLTRNAFLGPILIATSLLIARSDTSGSAVKRSAILPGFVIGFLALAALNSIGVIPHTAQTTASAVSSYLITAALAGIGLSTRFAEILRVGRPAIRLGVMLSGTMAVITFALAVVATRA